MANSLTRLTLYALISSIEEDLRTNLAAHIPATLTPQSVFGSDLLKKLATRSDSNGATDETSFSLEDLLMLCDYGDTIQLAHRFDASLPDDLKRQLDENSVELDVLIATRNRVMHSRPLEFDDL